MRQILFYAMTEAETFDPSLSLRSLDDITRAGFDAIYFEYRNTRAPRESRRFQESVQRIVREAKRRGLDVVLDARIGWFRSELLAEHPEGFLDRLLFRRVETRGGLFTLELSPRGILPTGRWRGSGGFRIVSR